MAQSRKRKKVSSKITLQTRQRPKSDSKPAKPEPASVQLQKRDQRFDVIVILIVVALGIYFSWLYFGHQPVPNSDFVGFTDAGHAVIDYARTFFHDKPIAIQSFKRVPGLGLLQVALSYLMPGDHPELTAGWLLNGILYTLTGIFLYLIGKKFIGKN
ncbi:MAG: hypothetical protein GY869_05070, partial [Planctomycetes bacterium]|nr:hypothetical protein [Planctomycetota bacterium]